MHPSIIFKQLFDKISAMLLKLGFLKNSKGFSYLCHTIYFGVVEEGQRYDINSKLFPKVANLFDTKLLNIERNSRHALNEAYLNGGFKQINEVLNMEYLLPYEKPTLTNFISTLIEKHVMTMGDMACV